MLLSGSGGGGSRVCNGGRDGRAAAITVRGGLDFGATAAGRAAGWAIEPELLVARGGEPVQAVSKTQLSRLVKMVLDIDIKVSRFPGEGAIRPKAIPRGIN